VQGGQGEKHKDPAWGAYRVPGYCLSLGSLSVPQGSSAASGNEDRASLENVTHPKYAIRDQGVQGTKYEDPAWGNIPGLSYTAIPRSLPMLKGVPTAIDGGYSRRGGRSATGCQSVTPFTKIPACLGWAQIEICSFLCQGSTYRKE
jgi:hypothetical protein